MEDLYIGRNPVQPLPDDDKYGVIFPNFIHQGGEFSIVLLIPLFIVLMSGIVIIIKLIPGNDSNNLLVKKQQRR